MTQAHNGRGENVLSDVEQCLLYVPRPLLQHDQSSQNSICRLCKVSVCQSLRNIAWTHCNALHEPTLVTHNLPRITRIPASY